jgi:NadR type nicotinamide-nucleotide adenylyltransferase
MKRALVLGKFMPPHAGHRALLDFARNFVDHLTILVCSRPSDVIPGVRRTEWLAEMFPNCRVRHFAESAEPRDIDEPDFWHAWRENIRRIHPEEIDYLITPEPYGKMLSEKLGVRYVHGPDRAGISGTDIRTDPFLNWNAIPSRVRPWFAKRVCVHSPGRGDQNNLPSVLAEIFNTVVSPRFTCPGLSETEQARARIAENKAAAYRANRILFLEDDSLTFDPAHDLDGDEEVADLYLLNPGTGAGDAWEAHLKTLKERIERKGGRFCVLEGSENERGEQALREIRSRLPELAPYIPLRFAGETAASAPRYSPA